MTQKIDHRSANRHYPSYLAASDPAYPVKIEQDEQDRKRQDKQDKMLLLN